MNHRYVPFGYCIRNGVVVIVPNEARTINKIYSKYLSGESLKNIAISLTEEKIEYLPGKWQWNKNRVVRIIDDIRYIGDDTYETIVEVDIYQKAQNIKSSKSIKNQYDFNIVMSSAVVPILCGKCGCITKRIKDNRQLYNLRHICINSECRTEYIISDDEMIKMLSTLLKEAGLSLERTVSSSDLLEIHRLEQEIVRTLEYSDIDVEKARAMIFECANKKYQTISRGRENYDKLEHDLKNPQFKINRQTVMELVKQIKLIDDNNIQVTLINGQILGKEPHDGTGNSES